jgi:hypothetical protein
MERNQRPIEDSVGDLLLNVYGAELAQFCHFGKEPSIIHLLIKGLMSMEIDLRPLLGGAPIYDTKKHIKKLGLHLALPGLFSSTHTKPDKFMKGFIWKSASTAVMSEGIGVNMWAILLMASLMGSDEIHCKSSSRVASSILSLILGLAPSAATPGNIIPVRSFNEKSRHPDVVVVSSQNRCEHFIRPLEDDNLAINGNYTYCQVDGKFVPEDYLGCSYVMEMSKFLKCKYEHVPAKHVMGHYQLMQERFYPIYRNGADGLTEADGNLIIDKHGVHVEYDVDRAETFTFIDWHAKLRNLGFLVMPCVWRSGAGVYVGEGDDVQVGCLVPTGTKLAIEANFQNLEDYHYISNYDHIGRCYHALVQEDTLVSMPVLKTMDNLIPPGTVLWLKPGGPTWNTMTPQFPRSRISDGDADMREVQVRLNIPIDQVHASVL